MKFLGFLMALSACGSSKTNPLLEDVACHKAISCSTINETQIQKCEDCVLKFYLTNKSFIDLFVGQQSIIDKINSLSCVDLNKYAKGYGIYNCINIKRR